MRFHKVENNPHHFQQVCQDGHQPIGYSGEGPCPLCAAIDAFGNEVEKVAALLVAKKIKRHTAGCPGLQAWDDPGACNCDFKEDKC